jgi:preprotein translocase subunit SecB
MEEKKINTAAFRLRNYRVIKSNIELKGNEPDNDFSMEIAPSGVQKDNYFYLTLDIHIKDKKDTYFVDVLIEGIFEFKENIDNLSDYFLTNAPAILFPYARAYISSLTSISGIMTVIIPTLNLIYLKEELKGNIKYEQ